MAASALSKVSFPLKWKIIGTNASLLLVTVFLLVLFASNLFNEDKSATIYETTLESSLATAERFSVFLTNNKSTFSLLKTLSTDSGPKKSDYLKKVFAENPHALAYASWSIGESKELSVYLENDLYLKTYQVEQKALLKKLLESASNYLNVSRALSFDDVLKVPLWLISYRDESFHHMALFSMDEPLKGLSESSQFKTYIAIDGELFSVQKEKLSSDAQELSGLMKEADNQKAQVINYAKGPVNYLAGIAPVTQNIFAVSLINDSIIYQASRFLREQSFYFSLFIFSLTIFIGVILSRRMTADLSKLHEATLAFSKGDFDKQFEVKSRDEIGSLAITFKKMGQDILRYIDEMKDKARLEKEMEVARLVQESFIPQEEMSFNLLKLSSFYRPTSECSGDWWGSFRCGDKLVMVVADATGHGVPAALMTATASGCLHQLEYDVEKGRRSHLQASDILDVFNYAIYKMGGKIHMTAFAMVIDSVTGEATYSNASHNPPLFVSSALDENHPDLEKDALVPLMGGQGARLGQELTSHYKNDSLKLKQGDLLYLYSDGLVEQVNSEGKQWGNRRFYKEILSYLNAHKGPQSLTGLSRHLLNELNEFSETTQWDDDITLLSLGFFQGELSEDASSRYHFNDEQQALVCDENNDLIYAQYLKKFPFKIVARNNLSLEKLMSLKKIITESRRDKFDFNLIDSTIRNHMDLEIKSTSELEGKLEEALESFDYDGYFDSPKNPFALLVRELTSNALYHQKEETSDHERTGEFHLEEGEGSFIGVTLGQGSLGLFVSVTDNSGRLTYDRFRNALMRAFSEQTPEVKEGGAGLGLYMVFQNSNKVIIDVWPGKKTQIIAFIEKEKRYKNFRSKTTEFLFNERNV